MLIADDNMYTIIKVVSGKMKEEIRICRKSLC